MALGPPFAGAYLFVIILHLVIVAIMFFIRLPQPTLEEQTGESRPLREIFSELKVLVAVLTSMIGYGVMAMIMTATPLAMTEASGHHFSDAAFVIQWHVVGHLWGAREGPPPVGGRVSEPR